MLYWTQMNNVIIVLNIGEIDWQWDLSRSITNRVGMAVVEGHN